MKHWKTLLWLLCLSLIAGCVYEAANQSEADVLVEQYHSALKAADWDKVLSFYNEEFFKEQSREGWRQSLIEQHKQFGTLKNVHQSFAQKDPRYRGDYYIYGYTLNFERGKISETVTVFKGIEEQKLSIAGHTFKTMQGPSTAP